MSSTVQEINTRMPALALAAVIAAVVAGSIAVPPAASSGAVGSTTSDGYRPSAWVEAGGYRATGETPSLTTARAEGEEGTGTELVVGFGLVGAGLLGLVAAALTMGATERRDVGRRRGRGAWRCRSATPARTDAPGLS